MRSFFARRLERAVDALAPCPLPRQLELPLNARVLVFAPHPDDEVLGCGGTLALLGQRGCAVKVIVVTDGAGAGTLGPDAAEVRRRETLAALKVVGVDEAEFMDEPDGGFRNSRSFEQRLIAELDRYRPDWLFIPSMLDYHRDHVAASQALHAAWRRWRGQARLFLYELWSPLPATWVVDITSVLEQKKAAIACYATPLAHKDYLHANVGLAAYRGLYLDGPDGNRFAEAFVEVERSRVGRRLFARMLDLRLFIERLLP